MAEQNLEKNIECTSSYEYSVAVDPGWKNLGFAIVRRKVGDENISLVYSCVLNPAKLGGILPCLTKVCKLIEEYIPHNASKVYSGLERYVAYQGVNTSESENILMMIGALVVGMHYFNKGTSNTNMVRAIEWKTSLVKALFKWRKFNNPSAKLDKKFSIAAAKCIIGDIKIETDHECDSICIAALPFIPGFR